MTKKATDKKAMTTADKAALELASDFEAFAGSGFEEADADSFILPYLTVLQKGSPEVDSDDGAYIEGAKAGQFINTATKTLFDEVEVVPVHYSRAFVNWKERTEGGGFLGSYSPNDPIVEQADRDDTGKYRLEDGSYLADTRYHFILIVDADGDVEPAILGLSSTQIKKSRQWMSVMKNLKITRPDGTKFPAPMFSHSYKVTSVGEANDKGSWKGYKIDLNGPIQSRAIFEAAKVFADQVKSGAAKVGDPEGEVTPGGKPGKDDEDLPF